MKKFLYGLAVVAGLGAAQANASAVLFDLDPVVTKFVLTTTDGWGGEPSLVMNPNLGSTPAYLNAGDTWKIDLFSIVFPLVGSGNGTISGTLGFKAPSLAQDINDSATGSFLSLFVVNFGDLTWTTQPSQFSLIDGTKYSVVFENLSGAVLGRSVDVHAFLTLNAEPRSVPEPGTIALLGLGMLGVMYVSRRQLLARKA